MAITRAQQAKQLLANGGRIGYRGGADMGAVGKEKDISGAIGSGSKEKISASDARDTDIDRAREIYQANQTLKLLEEDKAQEPFETLIIKDSGIPGAIGMGLDALRGPRQFMLNKNVDFYRFDPRTAKAREKYGLTAQGYKDYMSARMAGEIDAAGNPIMSGDDDDNNIILPVDTTFNMASSDMDQGTDTTEEEPFMLARAFRADGGIMGGLADGQMDEMGRQMYGLGKLVKKATRAVKKIAKSPIGKAALLYAGGTYLGGLKAFGGAGLGSGTFLSNLKSGQGIANLGGFLKGKLFDSSTTLPGTDNKGLLSKIFSSPTALITGTSIVAGALTPDEENQAQQIADSTGFSIEEARNQILAARQDDFRARAFKAGGGLMRLGYQEGGDAEPVAKKTMPLIDMDGKEKDYRETGGFVDMGRMERADDVPARLSKNEFVFTADAVRNAGEGNIDKGAEVMYNMMKNLEDGGDVFEESQGLEGARKMFQTSQRLEEVL